MKHALTLIFNASLSQTSSNDHERNLVYVIFKTIFYLKAMKVGRGRLNHAARNVVNKKEVGSGGGVGLRLVRFWLRANYNRSSGYDIRNSAITCIRTTNNSVKIMRLVSRLEGISSEVQFFN